MVEPVTLGAIVALLSAKALERAGEKTLDGGEGALRRMVGALRRHFSDGGDASATEALARLEEAPDSPARQRDLAQVLDERLGTDREFASELEALVEEARAAGVDMGLIGQVAVGDQNVQSAGLVESEVNVTFGAPPAGDRAPRPRE